MVRRRRTFWRRSAVASIAVESLFLALAIDPESIGSRRAVVTELESFSSESCRAFWAVARNSSIAVINSRPESVRRENVQAPARLVKPRSKYLVPFGCQA